MYLPSFNLTGRHAVIPGITRGIGRAIARAYSEPRARVILISRTREVLNQTKDEQKLLV